jgi:hypothetical protein
MELLTQFDEPFDNVLTYAKAHSNKYNLALEIVLNNAFSDKRNLPNLGFPKKINNIIQPIPLNEYVEKLIDKYQKGYENRPSVKTGNTSKTFSDPAVGIVLSTRVKSIVPKELNKIIEGHSLQMSIENIIGDLLEEYLSLRLEEYGWYCCWGSSIDAVDFCKANGGLLQVKNSDNSENSSSSRVRNGTEIKKWARRKSTQENTFNWHKLIELTGAKNINEADFRLFIKETIEKNPNSIKVNNENIYSL